MSSPLKIIAVIPARYEASRFPGKLMKDLCGAPVIVRTYEAVLKSNLFDQVLVATDSQVIYDTISNAGGNAVMSTKIHECGSDRIAEAVENSDADIVINVQGDEPFTSVEDLKKLITIFNNDRDNSISLASLMHKLEEPAAIENPNNVKVIVDNYDNALYFSRAAIPYPRDNNSINYYKHIGIYAFRKQALIDFYHSNPTPLELAEKIECLRYLENNKAIKMVATINKPVGIDTPADLDEAIKLWESKN